MWVDEIVEETRKARADYAAEFEYDIAAIVADVKEKEKHSERAVVFRPPKPVAVPLAKASIDPTNPSVHLGLGIVFQLQGSNDMAIESLKEAIKLDQHFPEAHNSLGLTYSNMGQYRQALGCYESAAEGIIDIAYNQLAEDGERYFPSRVTTDGENVRMITPEVFDRIETILKSNLMWAINRNNIGSSLARLGEIDRAKEMFEESIQFIPDGMKYDAPYLGLRDLTGV